MSKSKSRKRKSFIREENDNLHQNLKDCKEKHILQQDLKHYKMSCEKLKQFNHVFLEIIKTVKKENVTLTNLLLQQKEEEKNDISLYLQDFNKKLTFIKQNMDTLNIITNADNLDTKLRETIENIQEIRNAIISVKKPNVLKYKEWSIVDIMNWISSLENGRYTKYLRVLQKGFESDGITSSILPSINQNVLRHDPFNIIFFPDRQGLINHFHSLSTLNVIDNEQFEGSNTEYH